MADNVKFDKTNLDKTIEAMKEKLVLRVGIIGSKATGEHGEDGLTNATLGTFHEFGSQKVKNHPPRRSFLEDSLKFKLNFSGEQGKALRKALFKEYFKSQKPIKFLQDLGAKCLLIIEEGFATNGFGMWKPLASSTERMIAKKHKVLTMDQAKNATMGKYRRAYKFWYGSLTENENGEIGVTGGRNILTETGKLRHSISFKVIKIQ